MRVTQFIEPTIVIRSLNRYEGRLFVAEGYLFLVVRVDEARDIATVTCRIHEETQVLDMPYAEVVRRLHRASPLLLDNLQGPAAAKRICTEAEHWYFQSREGRMGPYPSRREAERQLIRHVLLMQSPETGAPRRRDWATQDAALSDI
jgi:hypothetical protein